MNAAGGSAREGHFSRRRREPETMIADLGPVAVVNGEGMRLFSEDGGGAGNLERGADGTASIGSLVALEVGRQVRHCY